jgi:RNA polymerase sigma-70 factor (ECF subfamily)
MNINEYNEAVDLWSDRVFGYVLKLVRDTALAEDIVQDVYEKLWKKKGDVLSEKAKSYLFTSAYHAVVDWSRRETLKRSLIAEEVTVEQDHSHELKKLINEGLEQLSLQHKQLILLRDYEDYSYAEIGEITELSESMVKVSLHRARKQLKEFITLHWTV